MPDWSRPADIKAKLLKRWKKGLYLKEAAGPEPPSFPLRLALKSPGSREMINQFPAVQEWAAELRKAEETGRIRLEWKTINHQQLGRNALPRAALFETPEELARFLGKQGELRNYLTARARLTEPLPELAPWAAEHPFSLLDHQPVLDRLISVAAHLRDNPRPAIYLRQLSLPGIDTKFLESHRKILSQWLDILLPPAEIDTRCSRGKGFARRYGFQTPPELIRFRILDPELLETTGGWSDLTVPAQDFCRWTSPKAGTAGTAAATAATAGTRKDFPFRRVFITENDINGLSFPPMPESLVLFGRGYHFQTLAGAQGLNRCQLWYWGDIDTHGFAILNEFRTLFPHTRSLLMDRQTLLAHRDHWGTEPSPSAASLPRLNPEETELYQDLQAGIPQENLRLEQEFISYEWVQSKLRALN